MRIFLTGWVEVMMHATSDIGKLSAGSIPRTRSGSIGSAFPWMIVHFTISDLIM